MSANSAINRAGIQFDYLWVECALHSLINEFKLNIMNYLVNRKPSLNHLIDDFFNNNFFNAPTAASRANRFRPAVNVHETDDQYTIELIAAGREKGDFNIEMDADMLTISASMEKQTNTASDHLISTDSNDSETATSTEVATKADHADEPNFIRREYVLQSFKRSFSLPENVDTEGITANYENGILKVVLPKQVVEQPAVRTIEIGG